MKFTRDQFAAEALSWYPTPYTRRAAIKHVGADCASFLGAILVTGGFLPGDRFASMMRSIAALGDDWFMHKAASTYEELMTRYVPRVGDRMTNGIPGEPPGNILLMNTWNSKHRNHGGIVTRWPNVVHCVYSGVKEINVLYDPMWSHKKVSVYDPWSGMEKTV